MPQWNDFVDRFRPAGTPGAAARPGVPADRSAEAAAELTPLFALLDDTQDEVERIRSAAAERADEILRAAHRQADQIAAQARADAESVRAQAEAEARGGAEPGHARRQDNLRKTAYAVLGSDADVVDHPDGGVVAVAGQRRLDLSLAAIAEHTLDHVVPEVNGLWA